ncbi:protein-(glutamine-N5) methyltransferase [Candidatus Termititenax aidoneus]|uniref:Release factor glutamine methyltransferase n=1 Tax=Termititenax aidoneus TaxID=2218524 RepID=A0A388T9S1_TERA1|nr:protein-(glutamine-N5) methyltransferase [Candidatus Termititenax aidoneus]
MSTEIWTILSILKWSEKFLREKGVAAAKHGAECLLAFVLGCQRLDLYLRFDQPLTTTERAAYKKLLLRRASREPLQYITGEAWFMSEKFKVSLHTLIPRYDTEILAETVLRYLDQAELIVDIGAGSGILAVTFAKRGKKVLALDISPEALAVAKANAAAHQAVDKIEFICADLLAGVNIPPVRGVFLVSNPPYISPAEYAALEPEVREHEPRLALLAQNDGLEFYQKILAQSGAVSDLKGVFFEVGHRQAGAVAKLLQDRFQIPAQIVRDLGGKERVVYTLL